MCQRRAEEAEKHVAAALERAEERRRAAKLEAELELLACLAAEAVEHRTAEAEKESQKDCSQVIQEKNVVEKDPPTKYQEVSTNEGEGVEPMRKRRPVSR